MAMMGTMRCLLPLHHIPTDASAQCRASVGDRRCAFGRHQLNPSYGLSADDDGEGNSYDNPPFFPKTVLELAQDTSFSIKLALINRLNRMRVDIRSRLLTRERPLVEFIVLTASLLVDDEFERIHVFIDDKYNVTKWNRLCDDILAGDRTSNSQLARPAVLNRNIVISTMDDRSISALDSLFIIFNPDNLCHSNSREMLENVQALCFHASLQKKPVVMFNPRLVATAWNNYGPRSPMLLNDFEQTYHICDDYFMLSSRDKWIGIVHRLLAGVDVFYLEMGSSMLQVCDPSLRNIDRVIKFTRIKSWKEDAPHDIRQVITDILLADPSFGSDFIQKSYVLRMPGVVYPQVVSAADIGWGNRRDRSWHDIIPPPKAL